MAFNYVPPTAAVDLSAYATKAQLASYSTPASVSSAITTALTDPDLTNISAIGLNDTNSLYSLNLVSTGGLTANRNLTVDANDAERGLDLNGDLTLAGNLSTAGGHAATLTTVGTTNCELPTSGRIATLNTTQTFTAAKTFSNFRLSTNSIVTTSGTINTTFPAATGTLANIANQTHTAPAINGATMLSLDDSNSAYNLEMKSTSGLTSDKSLTVNIANVSKTLTMGGNISTANSFNTYGNYATALTATAVCNATLPAGDSTLAKTVSDTFTTPTINNPTITNSSGFQMTIPGGGADTLVSKTGNAILTNKTLSTNCGLTAGGNVLKLVSAATSVDRTLTFDSGDADRTLTLGGDINIGGSLTTGGTAAFNNGNITVNCVNGPVVTLGSVFNITGKFSVLGSGDDLIFTKTGSIANNITLPSGVRTLQDLDSTQEVSNKTFAGGISLKDKTTPAYSTILKSGSTVALTSSPVVEFDCENTTGAVLKTGPLNNISQGHMYVMEGGSNQSITSGAFSLVSSAWDTSPTIDVGSFCSESAGAFTVTTAGRYMVTLDVYFSGDSNGSPTAQRRLMFCTVNSTSTATNRWGQCQNNTSDSTMGISLNSTAIMSLATNDVLRVYVFQDSGQSLNVGDGGTQLNSRFSIAPI